MVVTVYDHIAELRARVLELQQRADALPLPAPDVTPLGLASGLYDVGSDLGELATVLEALERTITPTPIADQAPALESWRRAVLEKPAAYSKRDQAAAWELTALEAERKGNLHAAERAKREAGFALGIRGAA